MNKKIKPAAYIIVAVLTYIALSLLFGIPSIMDAQNKWQAALDMLPQLWYLKIMASVLAALLVFVLNRPKLDIKAVRVGHGQHGDARFMDESEERQTYDKVSFGNEDTPGFLVGLESGRWVVDTSDNNMMLLSPPGGGKTTGVYIPTIEYNGRVNVNTRGKGASMIIVDIKGTLYEKTAPLLQTSGYRTPVIDLRNVFNSYRYNVMYRVNEEIDLYKAAKSPAERAIHYGRAERYAKIAAAAIIDSMEKAMASEGSEYFNESAKGLVNGLILLISEYAAAPARHIMSVFDLIIQLNGGEEGMLGGIQTTKLAAMMKDIKSKRVQSYMGAATGADIRTMLNIFSSALAKLVRFIDAELEQLLCGHSPELSAKRFIESPTAIFVICPDENPTRHFLASLFIRSMSNDLIEIAETEHHGVLPRQIFYFLDEFGNLPSIQHVVSLFSAIRSRGGRILCALQSYAQLLDNYSKDKADIIRDTCQMLMFSFVAPSSEGTATSLSKMLGNETVMSGSNSASRGVMTYSNQMIGRPLVSPDQLVTLPKGTFIVQKGGCYPYKGKLKGYWEYIELEQKLRQPPPQLVFMPVVLALAEQIEIAASGKLRPLEKGMFD